MYGPRITGFRSLQPAAEEPETGMPVRRFGEVHIIDEPFKAFVFYPDDSFLCDKYIQIEGNLFGGRIESGISITAAAI